MNLWNIELKGKCKRFAASQADARVMRDAIVEEFDCKKAAVVVEPCDVPTKKPELIQFLNEAYAAIDAQGASA